MKKISENAAMVVSAFASLVISVMAKLFDNYDVTFYDFALSSIAFFVLLKVKDD